MAWKALFWKVRVYNDSLFWRWVEAVRKKKKHTAVTAFLNLPGSETSFCSSVFSLVISLQSWMSSILRGKQTNNEERHFTGNQVMQVKPKGFKNMDFISWLQSNFLPNYTQTSVWNCTSLSNIITLTSVSLLAALCEWITPDDNRSHFTVRLWCRFQNTSVCVSVSVGCHYSDTEA